MVSLSVGRYWRDKLFTKLRLGALTAACAFFVLAAPAFAGGEGRGFGGHGGGGHGGGGHGGCHEHCGPGGGGGNGVPLPIAGAGLLALAAGGYVLSRRRKEDEA